MEYFFNKTDKKVDIFSDKNGFSKTTFGSFNSWHVAHFRAESYFQYKQMPFTHFFLDLNYLFCYVIPIFEKIENIKYAAHLEIVFPEINARKTLYECNMI